MLGSRDDRRVDTISDISPLGGSWYWWCSTGREAEAGTSGGLHAFGYRW